jgi:hypothetical protein
MMKYSLDRTLEEGLLSIHLSLFTKGKMPHIRICFSDNGLNEKFVEGLQKRGSVSLADDTCLYCDTLHEIRALIAQEGGQFAAEFEAKGRTFLLFLPLVQDPSLGQRPGGRELRVITSPP